MAFELPPLSSPNWLSRCTQYLAYLGTRGIGNLGRVGVGISPPFTIPTLPPLAPTPPITPDVGSNAPPPTSGPNASSNYGLPADSYQRPPFSIFHTGPRNPRGRPRPRKPITFEECVEADPTDTGVMLCAEQWGLDPDEPDYETSRGPIPPLLPPVPVAQQVAVRASVGVLARILNPAIAVLWPSHTSDDDTILQPHPQNVPRVPGKGPLRRPVVHPPVELPPPMSAPQPKVPAPSDRPRPSTPQRPAPAPVSLPTSIPAPIPTAIPAPVPTPVPTPAAPPAWLPFLPLLPGLPQLLNPPRTARPPNRFRQPDAPPAPLPLTLTQPLGAPSGSDRCSCAKPQRKRKGKRKARTVCYRGTYTETPTSLRKRKKERVPCQ